MSGSAISRIARLVGAAALLAIGVGAQVSGYTSAWVGGVLIALGLLLGAASALPQMFPGNVRDPMPDMTVDAAIDYIINDSVERLDSSAVRIMESGPAKGQTVRMRGAEHANAMRLLNTALAEGRLKAWGLRSLSPGSEADFEMHLRPIEQRYWEDNQLHLLMAIAATDRHAQTMPIPQHKTASYLYTKLTLSAIQVKAIWRPQPPWVTAWRRWRKTPRTIYYPRST